MITAGFHKRDSIVEYKIMWGWKFRVSTANICTGTHIKYTPYLKVRQSSESREECHSLSRSRWPTKHHGLVLGQPGVEEWLMADSVQGRHHNVRGTNLMGLHLNLGNLVVPLSPLTLDRNLHKRFTEIKNIMLIQHHIMNTHTTPLYTIKLIYNCTYVKSYAILAYYEFLTEITSAHTCAISCWYYRVINYTCMYMYIQCT